MKKTRKQKKETERKRVSNQIYQEVEEANSFALAQARRTARDAIDDPIPKLAWTRVEKGFEDARVSAENAVLRIWAGTAAARAGRESDPWLGVCLRAWKDALKKAVSTVSRAKYLQSFSTV